MRNRKPAANKNYMSIAVSVLTTSCVARNNGGAARQENRPQSATAYISVRYGQSKKRVDLVYSIFIEKSEKSTW
jgi:hypothetical protein